MIIRALQHRAHQIVERADNYGTEEVADEAMVIVRELAGLNRNTITVKARITHYEVHGGAIDVTLESQYGTVVIPVRGFDLEALAEDDSRFENYEIEMTVGLPKWIVA